jgi:uncharacterized repeat protein (TIGR01451 family)
MKKLLFFLAFFCLTSFVNAQWEQTNGPRGGQIFSFAVCGTNIFTGTGKGLYISANNGTDWTAVDLGISLDSPISSLAINGTNFFAGAWYDGVFLSTDSGTTWTSVNNGITDINIRSLAIMDSTIFAGTRDSGIFKSVNNGLSWNAVNIGLPPLGSSIIHAIAISGSTIFAGTQNGLFLSNDTAASWTVVNYGALSSAEIYSLAINGSDIFAGTGSGLYVSSDSGVNWTHLSNGLPVTAFSALAIDGTNIFAGTAVGLYISTDYGATWALANTGLPSTGISSLVINGTNIFAGSIGVFMSTNNGANWISVNQGLPYVGGINSIAVSGSHIIAAGSGSGIFSSPDGGNTWTMLNNNGIPEMYFYSLAANDSMVFAGSNGIYLSTDYGSSWATANIGLQDWNIRSFAFDGSNIYAGGNTGVSLSTNNAGNWTMLDSLATNILYNGVSALAANGNTIIAGTDYGMYYSTNNGTNWTFNTDIGQWMPVNSLVIKGAQIFTGTDHGIYISTNNGVNWNASTNGIPSTTVKSIVISGSYIFARTLNDGIYLSTNNGNSWALVSSGLPNQNITSIACDNAYVYANVNGLGIWKHKISNFNTVTYNFSGNVFNDLNNNGIKDNGENGLANIIIKTKADNWVFNTDSSGNYTAYSNNAVDSVIIINPSLYSTVTPPHYVVSASDTGKNFAVHYIPNVQDLRINVTNITHNARPGFNDVIYITYKNVGTDTLSGNVTLAFPNSDITFVSSNPVQSGINNGVITWNFANLLPLEQRDISVTFNVLPSVPTGSVLVFTGVVYPVANDTTPDNNHDGIEQTVTDSQDPNYKEVIPGEGFTTQQLADGDKLVYIIHFQNTGNDTAFNITIVDTLSQNLDASTFEIVSSSFPCTFNIYGTGIVEFYFTNILLPDSNVNLIGSNGFVKYEVRPKQGLILGDEITNTGYIYFDFNQPVATNTTSTLIDDITGLPEQGVYDDRITIFPNPATDKLTIVTLRKSEIEILNIECQLITSLSANEGNTTIDISAFAKGMYFVKVKTNKEITVKKFVKE